MFAEVTRRWLAFPALRPATVSNSNPVTRTGVAIKLPSRRRCCLTRGYHHWGKASAARSVGGTVTRFTAIAQDDVRSDKVIGSTRTIGTNCIGFNEKRFARATALNSIGRNDKRFTNETAFRKRLVLMRLRLKARTVIIDR